MVGKEEKLDRISLPIEDIPKQADSDTKRELIQAELNEKNRRLVLDEKSENQNRLQRKEYANKIYKLITGWLLAIFFLLILQGFGSGGGFFALSDKVLITLIGGTTINVLGIFIVVVNYLFFSSSERPDKPRKRPKKKVKR